MKLDIRPMSRADLEAALGWAREEGWNPGLDDAVPFYAEDPRGFLMGWLGSVRVGSISVVRYGERFAFLGLYIVHPAHRGRGYGKALWDAGIASAAGRTIGLDGVPDQQENYARSGFALAHRSARWGGVLRGLVATRSYVRPLAMDDLPALLAFDSRHVAAPRPKFLAAWLAPSATRQTEGFFDAGRLRGYGTIRRCIEGWKIGPLFAETPAIAEALLATLVTPAGTDKVFIDVPEPNAAGLEMVRRLGFTAAFETARMYLGPAPALPLSQIYGVTTLELG
ncbi:GNAT family N-acetyltransferase [Devosia sp.]|uniref:GNAT family N-acetyltransferase n=1 Tax=Devosia sp. TaxID=1871048 RepID=UPI0035B34271